MLKENNQLLDTVSCESIEDKAVTYMSYNSKDVKEDTLFICKGAAFKEAYLTDALKLGAFVYVSEKQYTEGVPCILVKNVMLALSMLANMYFNEPSKQLNMIGITGTKGKSTTAYFIKYILDEYAKSRKQNESGIISSIYTFDGKDMYKSKLTTPESFDLQRNLSHAVESGLNNVVMEVSSQALKYGRVHNVAYDISAFLNISEDHIGPIEHPDFEDYFHSKLKIFSKSKVTCINLDADYSDRILKEAKQYCERIITFSTKDPKADIYAYHIHKEGLYTVFNIRDKEEISEVTLTMPGFFNVENALAAICIAVAMDIPQKYIRQGLKKAKSAGRMEIYHSKDEKILGIVDYAHNKLSFQKIFETTKKEYAGRKIITVFGCPGNKAQMRRKDLGEEAGKNADYIYLTEDDPAYETVQGISEEIAEYIKHYTYNYECIPDRSIAIKTAVERVKNSSDQYIILILGKGNELTQKSGTGYKEYVGDSYNIEKCIKLYEKECKKASAN